MKVIVIPAQAGIWIRNKGIFNFIAGCDIALFLFFQVWIPACAGMTIRA